MPDAVFSDEFALPPEEVRRFFRAKKLTPSFSWRDVMLDEHASAFTVAKSHGYDILGDVKSALEKAIDERQERADFIRELEPILRKKGWWGEARQVDPLTGKTIEVQLGSPKRLKLIFEANVRTAYAAGEWERIWRTRRVLPYLEYLISTALHKRQEHLAWVGTALPVDDPWWDEHYPPNGWNCQCRVRQLSESAAKARPRFGDRPEDFGSREFENKRTGEVTRVPNGIDAGWNNNPGKARGRNAADLLAGRLQAMDEDMRRIASADLAGSALFRAIANGVFKFDPASDEVANVLRGQIALPFASLPEHVARAIGATAKTVRLSVADAANISGAARNIGGATVGGAARNIGGAFDPNDYASIQRLLDIGDVRADGRVAAAIGGEIVSAKLRVEGDGASVYVEDIRKGE